MDGMPGVVRPRRPEDFDALYTVTPPWDIGRPQPALRTVALDLTVPPFHANAWLAALTRI
jgi:hypothetical protein